MKNPSNPAKMGQPPEQLLVVSLQQVFYGIRAQNTARPGGSAIDGRTTRHESDAKSIHARRGIEKVFSWIKQRRSLRQFKLRDTKKVSAVFALRVIACNEIRLGNLLKPAMAVA